MYDSKLAPVASFLTFVAGIDPYSLSTILVTSNLTYFTLIELVIYSGDIRRQNVLTMLYDNCLYLNPS